MWKYIQNVGGKKTTLSNVTHLTRQEPNVIEKQDYAKKQNL